MGKNNIVLIVDPKVLAIPIAENNEDLINIKDQSQILIGPSPEIENNTCYTYMRKSVYKKLLEAQSLLDSNIKLCLYEGLRTLELQDYLFQTRQATIKQLFPHYSDQEIFEEVIKLVSPIKTLEGQINIPPHSTGAAVDVYLVDAKTKKPLEMGILAKDWMLDTEGKVSQTNSEIISDEAKRNRKILNRIMEKVGFVNYPTEYWHWSYGDRYWAFAKNQPTAFYGTVHDEHFNKKLNHSESKIINRVI